MILATPNPPSEDELPNSAKVLCGEVVAVLYSEQYKSCISCKSKVSTDNEVLGRCSKCDSTMKLSKCPEKIMAKVILETDGITRTVTLFDEVLASIIDQFWC